MIWVIAGTLDGRQLAVALRERLDEPVLVSVVSQYGAELAAHEGIEVHTGRLDQEAMIGLIREKQIRVLVDASHPYAAMVTATAQEASAAAHIPFIRFDRAEALLPDYAKLHHTADEAAAAALAGQLGERIYLTTGSKTLPVFAGSLALQGKKVWTRVLPTAAVVKECEELGYSPKYIVAVQGPFSYEMNKAMFKDTKADVVIMKNSGLVGGSDTKLQAAIDLGLQVIVIDRPAPPAGVAAVRSQKELFALWEEKHYGICKESKSY